MVISPMSSGRTRTRHFYYTITSHNIDYVNFLTRPWATVPRAANRGHAGASLICGNPIHVAEVQASVPDITIDYGWRSVSHSAAGDAWLSRSRRRSVVEAMDSFYIAMGQGIVASADMEVFTEALYSCTFITGRSASGRRGGAFHFPAGMFNRVRPILDQWLLSLRPVEVTLVFAQETSPGMGTPQGDQDILQAWVAQLYPEVPVSIASATAAGMRLSGGLFQAGNVAHHELWDPEIARDVNELGPGETYQLFDARHLMNADAPPVIQEATAGRRKRKRSWIKRHSRGCVIM